jgi:ribosomal protein S18 acetylase RimI-like enzyme
MNTSALAVRRGDGPEDRLFVWDLGRRSAESSVSEVRPGRLEDVVVAFERLLDFVYRRQHEVLIAELDGEPVGFLLLTFDIPDEVTLTDQAFVAYTAVEPHARRRGAARALLEEAERRGRAAGRAFISLMVTEDNLAARALYETSAFVTERRMMTKPL